MSRTEIEQTVGFGEVDEVESDPHWRDLHALVGQSCQRRGVGVRHSEVEPLGVPRRVQVRPKEQVVRRVALPDDDDEKGDRKRGKEWCRLYIYIPSARPEEDSLTRTPSRM